MFARGPMDIPYREIYPWMKREFALATRETNPPKIEMPLAMSGVSSTAFLNAMTARISNGYYGAKVIMCDMQSGGGRTISKTLLFSPANELVAELDSADLTAARCGIMAAIAVERAFAGELIAIPDIAVGLVGAGRLNTYAANALRKIHGIDRFVLKGSPRQEAQSIGDKIDGAISRTENYRDIGMCDVVITATSETSREAQTAPGDFGIRELRTNLPKLFISQDGGAILGEAFRWGQKSYSDDRISLLLHRSQCFPWDRAAHAFRPLTDMQGAERPFSVIYLYGMGFSDIVMACAAKGIAP